MTDDYTQSRLCDGLVVMIDGDEFQSQVDVRWTHVCWAERNGIKYRLYLGMR